MQRLPIRYEMTVTKVCHNKCVSRMQLLAIVAIIFAMFPNIFPYPDEDSENNSTGGILLNNHLHGNYVSCQGLVVVIDHLMHRVATQVPSDGVQGGIPSVILIILFLMMAFSVIVGIIIMTRRKMLHLSPGCHAMQTLPPSKGSLAKCIEQYVQNPNYHPG